jgi:hypothetical protein
MPKFFISICGGLMPATLVYKGKPILETEMEKVDILNLEMSGKSD